MQIAIASGKGGTGKTMVAVNLATAIARSHLSSISFLDCDVEAPNAALFLHPQFDSSVEVVNYVPQIDEEKCNLCGLCVKNCRFNALVASRSKILFFPDLCHSCGGCTLICPQGAITETPSRIGLIQSGISNAISFSQGELDIGHPSPVGVIQKIFELHGQETADQHDDPVTLVDSPPGVSCPLVASTQGSDFVILVTEPTPFGLHDLRLAVQLMRNELYIPCGVVINKSDPQIKLIDEFCAELDIPILQRIPFSRKIAEIYAKGQLLIDAVPSFENLFLELWQNIQTTMNGKEQ